MDNLDNKDDDLKRGPGPDNPEEGKPEAAPNPPEDHDDGKKEEKKRGKKNPYDQYKYWGSDGDGPSSGGPKFKGGRPNRVALIIFILLIASFIYMIFTDSSVSRQSTTVSYSQFVNAVESNAVADVTILDNVNIEFTYSNGMSGKSRIPYSDPSLMNLLLEHGVNVSGSTAPLPFWYIILQLLPWIIFIAMMMMIFRQTGAQGGSRMMGSFGKSHAQKYDKKDKVVKFSDVAGQKEAKYELEEVVDFLKHPERFVKIGARIPKGVLLVGPPGTGKTLLARAVAGEAGVNFFHTSGSDFVEMFVGMGAARVRDLFETGRKNAPCILFIDELDAVGRARGTGLGGGHDEREQTLNQMLVEMDGFSSDPGIIVIAATNRPDVLDPALRGC